MKKEVVFGIFFISLILLSSTFVFAYETTITVKGKFYQNIVIRVKDTDSDSVVKSVYIQTDVRGDGSADLETSRGVVDLLVMTIKNDDVDESYDFDDLETDEPIYLDLLNNEVSQDSAPWEENEEVIEEEQEEIEEVIENITEETDDSSDEAPITGEVIGNNETSSGLGSSIYYIIAGVLIIGIAGLVVMGMKMKGNKGTGGSHQNIVIKKQSELLKEKEKLEKESKEGEGKSEKIQLLEDKMKELQEEINGLKNEDRIKQAEMRIQKEQEELAKLREGEDKPISS